MVDEARRHVFRRLALVGITDLEEHIKFEVNITPPSWKKRYNLAKGSTHGLSHNLMQLGYFRPDLQHRRYRNLFFTGASTRPGTGIPTVMVSGRLAAERIVDFLHGQLEMNSFSGFIGFSSGFILQVRMNSFG